jgi:transposase InsO family protein
MEGEKRKLKRFDKAFKLSAVKMVTEGGQTAAEVARSLDIHPNILYNWKRRRTDDGEKAFPGKGHLTELDIFKSDGQRYQFISPPKRDLREEYRSSYPVWRICRLLEVSKSGYYAWRSRPKSWRRRDNERLLIEIRRVFLEHRGNYGSPRICVTLQKEDIRCSENRVARLMRTNNLLAVQRRKFRVTTDSKHNYPVAPNLLNRNFFTNGPNKVWVSDISYVWTWEGWLYLAFVLDLYHRGVVGLSMGLQVTDELTQNALKQAILRCNPPKGLIHHSDRGSQYASGNYQELLAKREIVASMSRKGNCWDNAVGESFLHTLKVELINRYRFKTREEAKREIFEYVEMYYNRKRAHSTLSYLSPFEFKKRALETL